MKRLFIFLLFSNILADDINKTEDKSALHFKRETTTTKGPNKEDIYKQRIEVVIPNMDRKTRTSTKFLLQIVRTAIAFAAAYNTTSESAESIQQFLEKYQTKFPELLQPGYEKIKDFFEVAKYKLHDDSIYKLPIKTAIFLAAYFATDMTWEDFVDFCKLPLYMVNSVKVAAALSFYYIAFMYYKGLIPKPDPSDGTEA